MVENISKTTKMLNRSELDSKTVAKKIVNGGMSESPAHQVELGATLIVSHGNFSYNSFRLAIMRSWPGKLVHIRGGNGIS